MPEGIGFQASSDARAGVVKRDVFEGDVPGRFGNDSRRWRRLDCGLRIQNFDDAFRRGFGARDHGEDVAQKQQGRHTDQHVVAEGDKLSDSKSPADDIDAAPPDGDRRAQISEDKEHRHHQGEVSAHLDVLLHIVDVVAVKVFDLVLLADKGLDDVHTGEVLLDQGIQLAQFLLHDRKQGADDAEEPEDNGPRDDEHRNHDEAEPPVDDEHHGQTADDHKEGPQQQRHAGAEEHAGNVDVAGDAGHELAGLHTVEVGEGEALDVAEQVVTQVEGDALGNLCAGDALADGGGCAENGGEQHDAAPPARRRSCFRCECPGR